jgi:excinuclease ABC subunit A
LDFESLEGVSQIDKLIPIDQSPIGRSQRSNPATFTGAFDLIRSLFSQTPAARARGYTSARFSFNRPGGRCETCQGQGSQRVDMHFLADVEIPCESCAGRRFNRETLEVTFKGRDISKVLDLTVDEARDFFGAISDVARKLESLRRAGLGYLRLGQPCDTLSGGEAQRLKLAAELARKAGPRTLYLLDEPTTGLHFADIQVLLDNLFALRDQGHTVLVVEHQLDVIRLADWVIELGPEGGPGGGRIIAAGPPEVLAAIGTPTGKYLSHGKDARVS